MAVLQFIAVAHILCQLVRRCAAITSEGEHLRNYVFPRKRIIMLCPNAGALSPPPPLLTDQLTTDQLTADDLLVLTSQDQEGEALH